MKTSYAPIFTTLARLVVCFFLVLTLWATPAWAVTPMVSAGGNHSCAVRGSGAVQCWGDNTHGQLGNGSTSNSSSPVTVAGIANAISVSAGVGHSCAVLRGGGVQCWGANDNGQLGVSVESTFVTYQYQGYMNVTVNYSTTPVSVDGISNAIAISAGSLHTCALLSGGEVRCWGSVKHQSRENIGELGNGTRIGSFRPVAVVGISSAVSITAGFMQSCATLRNGALMCWGRNASPDGTTVMFDSTTPVEIGGVLNAVAVSSNGSVDSAPSCALLKTGGVQCWGGGGRDAAIGYTSTPTVMQGIGDAVAVTTGQDHACALLKSGTVQCWGTNSNGELGNGKWINSASPVAVMGLANVTSIAAGRSHTCAALGSGAVQCWGRHDLGQRGNPNIPPIPVASTPVTVLGIGNATSVSVGDGSSCAVLQTGGVQCWGINTWGQLGNGSTVNSTTPVSVLGISNASAVSVDSEHACAVLQTGAVQCWGNNALGQLGNGNTNSSTTPVAVVGISNAIAVSAAYQHSCALLKSGSIRCWGNNSGGQLGDGSTTNSTVPVDVKNIGNAISHSAGLYYSCALLDSGVVQCWGYRASIYFQFQQSAPELMMLIPETASGVGKVISISDHSQCWILDGGTAQCSKSESDFFLQRIRNAVSLSSACAVLGDGTVQCWGSNEYGQLGNGSTLANNTGIDAPATVTSINSALSVSSSVGRGSSSPGRKCAVLGDGRVQCWGDDRDGRLGSGLLTHTAPNAVVGADGQAYLNLLSPLFQNVDKVFNWAEKRFPQFTPSGGNSDSILGYRYRSYQDRFYLAVNEGGTPHVYYFDASSMTTLIDAGLLSDFLALVEN